jgi:hypothetical protein
MARISYTGLVSDIKGSIAGTTFQHNSSGRIAKSKNTSRFSSSSFQSLSQAQFVAIVKHWRELTITNRTNWINEAFAHPIIDKWGVARSLTGFQYFISRNRNLVTIGQAVQDDPFTYATPLTISGATADADATDLIVNLDASYDLSTETLIVFASPPTQAIVPTSRVQQRLIEQYTGSAISSLNITATYCGVYGLIWATFFATAKCIINVSLAIVRNDNGVISPFFNANANVNL